MSIFASITRAVLDESRFYRGQGLVVCNTSAWRVVSAAGFEFGSGSGPTEGQIASLLGQSIVSVQPLGAANLDPSFSLGNGLILESFSATDYEPWELRFPGDIFILADGEAA